MEHSHEIMSSGAIQRRHPEMYKSFFSKYDLVLSGSLSMPWCPGASGHASYTMVIKSKIPLKCHVGISTRKDREIVFDDVYAYNGETDTFETIPYEQVNPEAATLKKEIRDFLDMHDYFHGADISVISEIPRGHSFNIGGTCAALISAWLHVLTEECEAEELPTLDEAGSVFRSIFFFAWKIEYLTKYRNSIGQSIYTTLSSRSSAGFMFSEQIRTHITPDDIESLDMGYFDMGDSFGDDTIHSEIPLDYAVVFSWNRISTRQVEASREGDIQRLVQYQDFIRKEVLPRMEEHENTVFHSIEQKSSLYEHFVEILETLNVKTIRYFSEFYASGYNSYLADEFIDHINDYRSTISLVEKQSKFAEDFLFEFRKNKSDNEERVGIFPALSGKLGGGYVIVMKPGISQETINKTLSALKSAYPGVALEYASYRDGCEGEAPKVEQFVSKSLFSQYTKEGKKVLFRAFDGTKRIMNSEEGIYSQDGLVVDAIHKKIYFNGERLTSKEIASQSATAELLTLLSEKSDVESSELPLSSYSRNKNEMIGKIISPLMRFYKEKFWQDLPLFCMGGTSEFSIRLASRAIPVGIITKIG